MLNGEVRVTVNTEEGTLKKGDVIVTPKTARRSVGAGRCGAELAVITSPILNWLDALASPYALAEGCNAKFAVETVRETEKDRTIRPINEILNASNATPVFKDAVRALAQGIQQDRIVFDRENPAVKVQRVVCKLLDEFPASPIERLELTARSGCADFVGRGVVHPGGEQFEFIWNCRWRAESLGWTDPMGLPEQMRAAQQLDYQCFKVFRITESGHSD